MTFIMLVPNLNQEVGKTSGTTFYSEVTLNTDTSEREKEKPVRHF